ncbi:MAG TPA: hypothetical protein PL193_01590 [Xanthobacteraceae bacterium]|nr:hypothetical protein [Xanthobacteraceae bacterium]
MALARLARNLLALTLAYSLVLSGLAGPVFGHGLGVPDQFCGAPADPASDPASAPHDCCAALCGSVAAILPSPAGMDQVEPHGSLIAPAAFAAQNISESHGWKSARAPPAR